MSTDRVDYPCRVRCVPATRWAEIGLRGVRFQLPFEGMACKSVGGFFPTVSDNFTWIRLGGERLAQETACRRLENPI